ncbi:hypothetical protein POSPLADRAFT_1152385 [Postia placenta MAD-698-R-SB12]|uniref:NAD(P)-binding protein n=1 Tax=Postia placenta MAD-698-R-SB12 TaxID=670580 RepID=A0A1X6MQB6_9APHY|nr:hypothetical protein POSPLADRAFT_1152385 [Postia placenta MAD-698-R-SB12]OSX58614.1 hypothetical protein POSPLADRAFT_1152385 [Postia placenta MAD-698-R-SB12]
MSSSAVPKYALITGCSAGGIGHALAIELISRAGYHVIATARRLESMEQLASLGATTMSLDVVDVDNIRKVRDAVAAMTGGKLHILVNNACRPVCSTPPSHWPMLQGPLVPVIDMSISEVRDCMDVNFIGPVCMVQEFVHLLIASGDGRILQIGSVGGIMPLPFCAIYNASKAALAAFGNTIRLELAPFNVKVTTVIAGGVKTNIVKPHMHYLPDKSMYKPYEPLYTEKRTHRASADGVMEPAQFARRVISEIVKPHPRAWLWAGSYTWMCWLVDKLVGMPGFVSVVSHSPASCVREEAVCPC